MKKAIWGLVVVFAVAAVASAVPAGPGGTLYFSTMDATAGAHTFYYLDVNSDWDLVDSSPGAVKNMGIVQDATIGGSNYYGIRSGWYHPTSGKLDMNGSYHDGRLLLGTCYNDTPPVTGADLRGADILSVSADSDSDGVAEVAILNDGVNGPAGAAGEGLQTTTEHNWQLAVDDGFTQGGAAQGFAAQGKYGRGVWVDSNADGQFLEAVDPGKMQHRNEAGYGSSIFVGSYSAGGGTVNVGDVDKQITGAVTSSSRYGWYDAGWKFKLEWMVTYKIAESAGGGYHNLLLSTDVLADIDANSPVPHVSNPDLQVTNTTDDGKLDFYYRTNSTDWRNGSYYAHAMDLNGDGDILDFGEAWESNIPCANDGCCENHYEIEFAQCPDGSWVALQYAQRSPYWWVVTVTGLDDLGNYSDTDPKCFTKTILINDDDSSFEFNNVSMVFLPLGEAIPEPATMMLVGTGLLSLVGVIRRRRLN